MGQGQLLDWLRETRDLEEGAVEVMDRHAPRLGNHPSLGDLLTDNRQESQAQAIRLRACIDALGGDGRRNGAGGNSAHGRTRAALENVSQELAQVLAEEETARGMLALYALKHLEIGSYRFMAKLAETCHEPDIAALCRHSLDEEIEMAARLELELETIPDE